MFEREDIKKTVEEKWRWLADQYQYVDLDEFIVMPNHLHGIIFVDSRSEGRSRTAPTGSALPPKRLGSLIGAFKTVSTQEINRLRRMPGEPVWQRNFHDHIVRDEQDLNRIREYILDNPRKWQEDPEHP